MGPILLLVFSGSQPLQIISIRSLVLGPHYKPSLRKKGSAAIQHRSHLFTHWLLF